MDQRQFIRSLDQLLNKLDNHEREDIIRDFEEHFTIGLEKGKSEEEIAASLGAPHQIAKDLMAEHYLEKAERSFTFGNAVKAAWAAIGLGFFNFTIVLGPLLGLLALVASGWGVGLSFLAAPILVVVNLAMHPASFHMLDLFVSIALAGAGILLCIGMMVGSRAVFKWFVKYLRYNIKLVKGGLSDE